MSSASGFPIASFRLQPPLASIHCSHPEAFLAEVIREEGNLDHRIRAAYAYLTVSDPQKTDPGVLQAIPGLIEGATLDMTKTPRAAMWIGSVIGGYYARVGTPADIPRLQSIAASFPLPPGWTADNRTAFERELNRDLRRAIDAIRLRGN